MKRMKLTKLDLMTALLTLCSMIPGIVVYNRLPERIATHFDINNQPDGWSGRAFAVFGIPLIMTALHLLACLFTNSDERVKNSPQMSRVVRFLIPVIAFVVETAMVLFALEKITDIGMIALCLTGILMIIIGNYLPKTRQNSFVGIRTKKTLGNEEIWNKTHRFAGFVETAAGVVIIPLAVLSLYIPAVIVLFVAILIPFFYLLTQ